MSEAKLTIEQQLDVLWALMSEDGVLVGVVKEDGSLSIHPIQNNPIAKGQILFTGTREQIIEQLCARQVANRLAG